MNKLLILGSNGLIGRNALAYFSRLGAFEILSVNKEQLDLRNQSLVNEYFREMKPDIVLNSAANVGGLKYNIQNPNELLLENLMISTNILSASLFNGVSKLINFGSSCMYPTNTKQPMIPMALQLGKVEKTSEYYAMYKLASWKMVEAISTQFNKDWVTIIPATIYGPNDNFSLEKCHVLSALIRKFHEAKINSEKSIILWGDGSPLREFIYIDDLLDALSLVIEKNVNESIFNVGPESEISINELALKISMIVGYKGEIAFDRVSPNGSSRKLLDSSFIKNLGWHSKVSLDEGINRTYAWYKESRNLIRL